MNHDSKDSSPKPQDKMPLQKPADADRTQREVERIFDQEQNQSNDEKHNRDRV